MMRDQPVVGIDASRSYREPMTGTERYSRRIIEHLMSLDLGDLRVRLYFNQAPPESTQTGDSDVRVIPARRLWTHYRLSRELRENPVDLLFVPSHVLPIVHPERTVVTIHDLGYLYEPDSHTRASRLQLDLTTRWNARQATQLVAISESTRQDLNTHCQVDPDRISVIRLGVDEQFQQLPPDIVEKYRQAARLPERFLLYLGTIQPRKNLIRLIEAFEYIAAEDQDVQLILAGKPGWKSEPIRNRAQSSQVRDRIRFLGYVPDEQLPQLYNAATALALPSLYEGFGLPVIEAMACGVPVIMSNVGALPELAGADAAVVEPTDTRAIAVAIRHALDRRDLPDAITARALHASQFSWEKSARQTKEILWNTLTSPL